MGRWVGIEYGNDMGIEKRRVVGRWEMTNINWLADFSKLFKKVTYFLLIIYNIN